MNKTTLVAVLVLAGLAAYVARYETGEKPDPSATPNPDQVEVVPYGTTELAGIRLDDGTLTFEATRSGSHWRHADGRWLEDAKIEEKLAPLMHLKSVRVIQKGANASDAAAFGFDKPLLTVDFTPRHSDAQAVASFMIGNKAMEGQQYYAMTKPDRAIYIVDNWSLHIPLADLMRATPYAKVPPSDVVPGSD